MFLRNPRWYSERTGRDRIVVSTSRCGRDNPGSNPGHGRKFQLCVSHNYCQAHLFFALFKIELK